MSDRRMLHAALMIYRILNGEAPTYLNSTININKNNTRSINKLIINKAMNNLHKTSLRISGATMWNMIPDDIRSSGSIKTFSTNFEKYLLNK